MDDGYEASDREIVSQLTKTAQEMLRYRKTMIYTITIVIINLLISSYFIFSIIVINKKPNIYSAISLTIGIFILFVFFLVFRNFIRQFQVSYKELLWWLLTVVILFLILWLILKWALNFEMITETFGVLMIYCFIIGIGLLVMANLFEKRLLQSNQIYAQPLFTLGISYVMISLVADSLFGLLTLITYSTISDLEGLIQFFQERPPASFFLLGINLILLCISILVAMLDTERRIRK